MNPQKKKNIHVAKSGTTRTKVTRPIEKPSAKGNWYIILFFFIMTMIFYGNAVPNKFAIDDSNVTGPKNETVHKGFRAIPEILRTNYLNERGNIGSQVGEYRPVGKITFAIEYGLWGEKPSVSHLVNVLFYFWVLILLFFILKRIFKDYNLLFPFLITLLFLAHPIHTEVVASLKNREEMLAFLFGLYGLKFVLDYAEKKKVRYLIYSLIVFIIGYEAKSSIIPFLFIYPLTLYFFTDMKLSKLGIIVGGLVLAIAVAYYVPRLFISHGIRVNSYIENPLYFEKNFWIRTGTAMMSLLFYLKMLVYPYPMRYYYGFDMIPMTGWGNLWVIFTFLVYAGLLIYAFYNFRKKSLYSYAILVYLFFISMFSNLLTPVVGIVAERFLFGASLGFVMLLVLLIFRVNKTNPRSLTIEFNDRFRIIAIVILLLIPSAYLTIKRNREWRDTSYLYRKDILKLNNSAKANIDYAEWLTSTIYSDRGYIEEGKAGEGKLIRIVTSFRRSLELYPDNYQVLNDLATIYLRFSDKTDTAMYYLKKSLALNDTLRPAWNNMAYAYQKLGKLDSALYCYNVVLNRYPEELNPRFKVADIYFEKGDMAKAVSINEEILKNHPELNIPEFNIGYYYFQKGDTVTAVKYWESSFQKKPTYETGINLYNMYKAKGDMQRASYYYQTAMDAQKSSPKQ
ncbi:MAG: tetratricopeptide repeat protein [Syntrophothermus sp.]